MFRLMIYGLGLRVYGFGGFGACAVGLGVYDLWVLELVELDSEPC